MSAVRESSRGLAVASLALGVVLAAGDAYAQDFPSLPPRAAPGQDAGEPVGLRAGPESVAGTTEGQGATGAGRVLAGQGAEPVAAGADPQGDPEEPSDTAAEGLLPVDPPEAVGPPPPDPLANIHGVSPLRMLGAVVNPGHRVRLSWTTGQSFSGSVMETPVVVVHGERPGPRLCLTAGTHGDELNGVEVVRRIAYKLEPTQLSGTIIAVPIVNLLGFSRGSRYLPDRRDLNRFFPGNARGSSASRIAASFFEAVIEHCDALVDFHTGSFDRANLPQVRGDLTLPAVVEFTRGFGATAVLHSPGASGMLRTATTRRGIPAVTFEIGAPKHLQPEEIEHGERAIDSLMYKMGMVERRRRWAEPQAVFYESRWIRANQGGMLFSDVKLGDRVSSGQVLGQVIDPVSNRLADIKAPEDGRIIGMALNQLVLPGFAAYHLGIAASEERVVTEAELESDPDDERFLEYDQLDSQDDELDDGHRDGPGGDG
ncbi:MAG: succinylglutamate desuccinylase/aspartoacylase family protein [Xanthomonadales bacterium]|nr:succinylglutamate desuccinylase/aspartoacylase family protein [Xanthomonadales bacterium]